MKSCSQCGLLYTNDRTLSSCAFCKSALEETEKEELPSRDFVLEVWKVAVETQQHFNDMSGKTRSIAVSFVIGTFGIMGFMLRAKEKGSYMVSVADGMGFHFSALLILSLAVVVLILGRVDLLYHRMLRGAVEFGRKLEEERIATELGTGLGLNQAITMYARYKVESWDDATKGPSEKNNKSSGERLASTYFSSIVALSVLSFLSLFFSWGAIDPTDSNSSTSVGNVVIGVFLFALCLFNCYAKELLESSAGKAK